MPIHDWTRVDAGLFHAFHQSWSVNIQNCLNAGILPSDHFALVEQRIAGPIPDVLTLRVAVDPADAEPQGGVAVAQSPPLTQVIQQRETDLYAQKANRIAIRHRHGEVVAVIEIISPGNKGSRADFRAFVQKSLEWLRHGIHLLVIDLFPPTPRDPQGIHQAIWAEIDDNIFASPADKTRTVVSYESSLNWVAYMEPLGVGDRLPDMPIFLRPGWYVSVPLESTYQATWDAFPRALRGLLQ
ncbi:MAG: DUF4058 family protein [Bacteroidales bacterium]|nr:DUF4058 family protein [Bacteroidales bacterium]